MELYNYFRSSASFRVRIALALKAVRLFPDLRIVMISGVGRDRMASLLLMSLPAKQMQVITMKRMLRRLEATAPAAGFAFT